MAVSVNFGDKIMAGNHIALTVTTEAGQPSAEVRIKDGAALEARVRMIDQVKHKYKVRFFLPKESSGELEVKISAGGSSVSETKAIEHYK